MLARRLSMPHHAGPTPRDTTPRGQSEGHTTGLVPGEGDDTRIPAHMLRSTMFYRVSVRRQRGLLRRGGTRGLVRPAGQGNITTHCRGWKESWRRGAAAVAEVTWELWWGQGRQAAVVEFIPHHRWRWWRMVAVPALKQAFVVVAFITAESVKLLPVPKYAFPSI